MEMKKEFLHFFVKKRSKKILIYNNLYTFAR